MPRFIKTITLALIIVGGIWILFNQDKIQQAGGFTNFLRQQTQTLRDNLSAPQQAPLNSNDPNAFLGLASHGDHKTQPGGALLRRPHTIRVASFKLRSASASAGTADPRPAEILTHVCRQFDIIAFQEVDPTNVFMIEQLIRQSAQQTDGAIRFQAITEPPGNSALERDGSAQLVILYNVNTLELDFSQWYSVNDPDDLLTRPPLVGWFRCRGAPRQDAFTFTLANIQLDSRRPDLELAYIGELFRAIRQDGRQEDDVIITGNFNSGDRGLSPLRKKAGLTWVVFDTPTTTQFNLQSDNLVFAPTATVEFTGRGGVIDFLAAMNLNMALAMQVSDHLPVWAEFSVFEGNHRRRPPLFTPSNRQATRMSRF